MVEIKEAPYNRLEYHGSVAGLFKIWIKNLLLKIITLGIYSFWAKVNFRRYTTSNFLLLENNFQYHGTPKELIKGFAKVMPLYGFALFCSYYSDINDDTFGYILVSLLFMALIYHSFYTGLRYKLSRTSWRGIRGYLKGSSLTYTTIRLKKLFFGVISFGYLSPKYDIEAYEYKINHIYYGNVKLRFKGNYQDLHATNVRTLLLFLPTIGLSRIWYRAKLLRYVYTYTKIGDLRFQTELTGGKLFKHYLLVTVITLFTLGLGLPIAYHLTLKFIADNYAIEGFIETSKIMQAKADASATGDVLESIADDDAGFF